MRKIKIVGAQMLMIVVGRRSQSYIMRRDQTDHEIANINPVFGNSKSDVER